ncbi:MAG: cyclically-permuted mutarotase family protein [Fermentimonas sp.]|nr:cyclically-permuted mutarotase family protein [Fermentimonas sp.]
MKINWNKLSTEGLTGDLNKGVSAAYAALIDEKLIVAGGANFPGKLGFEGGSKAFYDEIMLYNDATEEWTVIGRLPTPSAYGVSVPVSDGALWIGGNNEKESLKSCYRVSLTSNNEISLKPFVDLPFPMDNFSGCSSGDIVFVAGGNLNGKPSNSIYCIDTKAGSEWVELPQYPGIPRVQPVLASIETEDKTYVYLLGGFFGGDDNQKPAMATEILRYDVDAKEWSVAGEQIDPETGKPFSLGGAVAFCIDNRYIICLGGVNYDIFLDAITSQYNINTNSELTPEEKKEQNLNFSKHYMTQPVEYYKFNSECRVYDTLTGEWSIIDNTPDAARAGATLVYEGRSFYAVQGELKPGLRSSLTFKGDITTD